MSIFLLKNTNCYGVQHLIMSNQLNPKERSGIKTIYQEVFYCCTTCLGCIYIFRILLLFGEGVKAGRLNYAVRERKYF